MLTKSPLNFMPVLGMFWVSFSPFLDVRLMYFYTSVRSAIVFVLVCAIHERFVRATGGNAIPFKFCRISLWLPSKNVK